MKILICPDKFKECMTAAQVAMHIRKGIGKVFPKAECRLIPMADGGEGTVEALTAATGGMIIKCRVHDPLMRMIDSFYGISGDRNTAIIEMAAASGLALLRPEERNPMLTTTYGTGELIRHALDQGCREIILGIGGSATVDGGTGMARALGVKFLDEHGAEVGSGGGSLDRISGIDLTNRDSRLGRCRLFAACDVNNPLTGPDGAAKVYGPQKGATPEMVEQLNVHLTYLAKLIKDSLGMEADQMPGAGAAGGMGAGIVAFLDGELKPGFELISGLVKLADWVQWADLVVTGEGRMDFQTGFGKTPAGIAFEAKRLRKPLIAFTGALQGDPDQFTEMGFAAVIPIADRPMTLEESMEDAGKLLEHAAERTFRLIALGKIL